VLRKFKPVKLCNNSANCADSSVRFLVRCGFARADSPNRFVCNGDARCLFGGNTVVKCLDLTCKECVGNSGFALFKGFTHHTVILYGGSMNAKNAAGLKAMPQIDGGLIGGASLVAEDFAKVVLN